MLVYSDSITSVMDQFWPPPPNYIRYGFQSVVSDTFTTGIYTMQAILSVSETAGLYYLDFSVGDDVGKIIRKVSQHHPIWVGSLPASISSDIYVHPQGDDLAAGDSPLSPLKTISAALYRAAPDSLDPLTIHLGTGGHFSASLTGEHFPLFMKSHISIDGGDLDDGTFIDTENRTLAFSAVNVQNIALQNLVITGDGCCESYYYETAMWGEYEYWDGGGAVFAENSSVNLSNVTILGGGGLELPEYSTFDGSITAYESDIQMSGCTVSGLQNPEATLYTRGSKTSVQNSTFYSNLASPIVQHGDSLFIDGVDIYNNHVPLGSGGIYASGDFLDLRNSTITHNIGTAGGGLNVNCPATLAGVTIAYNQAVNGGGIYFGSQEPKFFSSTNRCNIYQNQAVWGDDLFQSTWGDESFHQDIVVDTFTVLEPTSVFAHPFEVFDFDILSGTMVQVNEDLYVSPYGDDTNSGLSPENPLHTISHALRRSTGGPAACTIYLAAGVYSTSTTGELFPVIVPNRITISGVSPEETILDVEGQEGGLRFEHITGGAQNFHLRGAERWGISAYQSHVDLLNISISGAREGIEVWSDYPYSGASLDITNVSITNTQSYGIDGRVNLNANGLKIIDNEGNGLRMRSNYTEVVVANSVIANNGGEGMILQRVFGGSATLNHVTVTANGQTGIKNGGPLHMRSCILRGNGGLEYTAWNNPEDGNLPQLFINYSNVDSSVVDAVGDVYWQTGNIDMDPMFCNTDTSDYRLQEGSPCSGTGQDGSNMGGMPTGCGPVVIESLLVPDDYGLEQNFPNPFNPVTTIAYDLPEETDVSLVIYDIQGRNVVTLINARQLSGHYHKEWRGLDKLGNQTSTGVYFCRLQAGKYSRTIKMVYLK